MFEEEAYKLLLSRPEYKKYRIVKPLGVAAYCAFVGFLGYGAVHMSVTDTGESGAVVVIYGIVALFAWIGFFMIKRMITVRKPPECYFATIMDVRERVESLGQKRPHTVTEYQIERQDDSVVPVLYQEWTRDIGSAIGHENTNHKIGDRVLYFMDSTNLQYIIVIGQSE